LMLATLRQRNFALLWFGGLISLAGNYMLYTALPIFIYQLTGSVLTTSAMFIAELTPTLLLGSVAGVFVDRWDRRHTMIVANLLMAIGLLPLLGLRSAEWVWLAYVVGFAQATLGQFFRPAESALLPQLVDEQHLLAANALSSLNNNLARLFGAALGGLAAGLIGLSGVVLLDLASFLIAAGMIACISGARTRAARATAGAANLAGAWLSIWRDWLAGLRLIQRDRIVLIIFIMLAITSVGEGIMSVLFVVFVSKVLHGGALELGWLMAAQGAGGLIGGLVIGALSRRIAPARLLGISAVAFGAIDLAIFNYPLFLPGVALGLILFVLVGIPAVGYGTSENTLLQTAVADEYRGRIFGAVGATQGLLMLVGALLAGALGDRLGSVAMLNVQGGGYVLVGVICLLFLNEVRPRATLSAEAERAPRVA
jgi:MFS family permease